MIPHDTCADQFEACVMGAYEYCLTAPVHGRMSSTMALVHLCCRVLQLPRPQETQQLPNEHWSSDHIGMLLPGPVSATSKPTALPCCKDFFG